MKFPKKTVLASLLLLSTTSAFAVDTADLIVTGTIAPAACTPSFSGGATVDYGRIPTASLSETAVTNLAAKSIGYSISCDAPISVGFSFTDSRTSSTYQVPGRPSSQLFGLGMQGSAQIGAYELTALKEGTTGDGAAVDMIYRNGTGAWTLTGTGAITTDAWDRTHSFADTGELTPGTYSTVSGTINVIATIAPSNDLDLTEAITLDGLSTMVVRYL